jgi:hypothetical protein
MGKTAFDFFNTNYVSDPFSGKIKVKTKKPNKKFRYKSATDG